MILSFHPCYSGDENRLCAGREPDNADRSRIRAADAVILPQGCPASLFRMARANCARVFPDYTARFDFPGKNGQIRLFRQYGAPHPESLPFEDLRSFRAVFGTGDPEIPFGYPFVFKFGWSGEGANVWRIDTPEAFREVLDRAAACERTGQSGFLLQQYVETGGRSLRVAVIGAACISYWRVQPDPDRFGTGVAEGAVIDPEADPGLQEKGKEQVQQLCAATGINLAGFDLVFDAGRDPLFLEINYYFGRRGLGGSERYYELLCREIDRWLAGGNLRPDSFAPEGSGVRAEQE